jgi:hypothetical protein
MKGSRANSPDLSLHTRIALKLRGLMQTSNADCSRLFCALLLGASFLLFGLHYVHLKADFPHFSPWPDPARTTDEGWYAGAALRHYLSGGWLEPGDFNPAVAVPVFPAFAGVLFHFTGVSIVALRAMNVTFFGASLVAVWLLVRRYSHPLAAAGAVFLVACCPFYYAYSRLGTVEPLLSLENLLALLAASSITRNNSHLSYKLPSLAVGVLLAAMIFTKTPGLCLWPAVFYLMASRCHFNFREYVRPAALAGGVAMIIAVGYRAMIVRAGLVPDFDNLFAINRGRIHGRILLSTLWAVAKEGSTMGPVFYYVATAAILLVVLVRRNRQSPLFVASILGVAGYGAFITYHGWLMTRYYVVPMPLVAMALASALAVLAQSRALPLCLISGVLTTVLLFSCLGQIHTMLVWMRNPSYSFYQASAAIYRIIDRDPSKNRVVLGASSEQVALLTDEPGIFVNQTFGTVGLRTRVLTLKPGWFIDFDGVGPETLSALQGLESVQFVDSEPAFGDDGIHYQLLLYKLTPIHP